MRQCQPHIDNTIYKLRNCIGDYRKHQEQIMRDYCNMVYAWYLQDLWDMEVGYRVHPKSEVLLELWLLQWQKGSDCGSLCTDSHSQPVTVGTMAKSSTTINPCSIYLPLNALKYESCCSQGHNRHRGQDYFHMS